MLLSYTQILDLLDAGVVTNVNKALLNGSTLDIRLGPKVLIEHCKVDEAGKKSLKRVSLKNKDALDTREYDLQQDGPLVLFPGEFILAHSIEVFNLPNTISAHYVEKSSMARIGLNHLSAGWCDPGWNGSVLTLELQNITRGHEIELNYMDKIGQMIFYKHQAVPSDKSYAIVGRYNNNKSVSGVRLDPMRDVIFGDDKQDEEAELYELNHPVVAEEVELLEPKKGSLIIIEGDGDGYEQP